MALIMTYDPEADVLYLDLAPGAAGPDSEGEEVYPGVVLMFNGAGKIIGVEITSASKQLPAGAVERLPVAAE